MCHNLNKPADWLYEFDGLLHATLHHPVMLDDHSKLAPLLPIPNRTVKRLRADDSADSRVKVGHRQALTALNQPGQFLPLEEPAGLFLLHHGLMREKQLHNHW